MLDPIKMVKSPSKKKMLRQVWIGVLEMPQLGIWLKVAWNASYEANERDE